MQIVVLPVKREAGVGRRPNFSKQYGALSLLFDIS